MPHSAVPSLFIILRLRDVIARVSLSRSNIYRLQKAGDFPAQVKLGTRAVGWLETEINDWVQARASRRGSR